MPTSGRIRYLRQSWRTLQRAASALLPTPGLRDTPKPVSAQVPGRHAEACATKRLLQERDLYFYVVHPLMIRVLALLIVAVPALAQLSVLVGPEGLERPLRSFEELDAVHVGSSSETRLRVRNDSSAALTLDHLAIAGAGFSIAGASAPRAVPAGGSVEFSVRFAPASAGSYSASLSINESSYILRAAALPSLPVPELRISVNLNAPESGQQVSVTVSLGGAAPSRVTGELALSFVSDIADTPADAAVQFASGGRSVAFEIAAGQNAAAFGTESSARFQTGTTAGTLILNARAGSRTAESRLRIAPAPVKITTVHASKGGTSLEVNFVGLDNARTAGQVSYTFFDTGGAQIGQPIRVDAGEGLRGYFRTSATGGAFALRAVFPVTGDAARIGAVEVETANSAGTSRPERVLF